MTPRSSAALRTTVLGAAIRPRRVPLCPELELLLLSDDVDLRAQVHAILEVETAPFWPFAWAGGQALARYVLDHPETVAGKTVVDLGTGSGIAAIAAAKAGASSVLGVDLAEEALVATEENARRNGVLVTTSRTVPASFDVLLASDVLYEAEIARVIAAFEAEGRVLYLGEPGRAAAPKLPHAPLARYACTTHPDVDAPIESAAVYRIASTTEWAALRTACDR